MVDPAGAIPRPRVLIVGNSYFYYNNLVHTVKGLTGSAGAARALRPLNGSRDLNKARYLLLVQGGAGLEEHVEDFPAVLKAFDPDIVFIQDFSMGPCDSQRRQKGLQVVRKCFAPAVKDWLSASAGSVRKRSIFFNASWARCEKMFEEPNRYKYLQDEGKPFSGEADLMNALEQGTLEYAEALREALTAESDGSTAYEDLAVGIVPTGRVWNGLRQSWAAAGGSRGDSLYCFDSRGHPSPLGTFVMAATFWKAVFGGAGVRAEFLQTDTDTANLRETFPEIASFYYGSLGEDAFKGALEWLNGEAADAAFAQTQGAVPVVSSAKRRKL